jgi:hypothetical protein
MIELMIAAFKPAIPVIGSIVGQILHIVKKRTEERPEESEGSIVRKWVLSRPINTVASALAGGSVAVGVTGAAAMPAMIEFVNAVIIGIAANSMVNRPGAGE